MVHYSKGKSDYKHTGVKEYTVNVPLKPPLLATIKSNNYLLNALVCEQAQEKGGFLGIQMDADGLITEGSIGREGGREQGRDGWTRISMYLCICISI